ncbi:hypothetical protein AB0N97_18020, partial [Streptomyces collinus]|uniref:hypothetical protein n=1 Tax=Streptomyces collinus TaxID=42684 RepID=UPI0034261F44
MVVVSAEQQTAGSGQRAGDRADDRLGGLSHLEVLTKALDVAVGDQTGGEAEERFVDVVASLP